MDIEFDDVDQIQLRRAAAHRLRRRRRLRTLLWLAAIVVVGAVSVWLLWFSSVFAVTKVTVLGTTRVLPDDVTKAAAIGYGTPMITLNADAIADRVKTVPVVSSVEVRKGWPNEVVLVVTERQPVAVVHDGTGWLRVDPTGFPIETLPSAPLGVPIIEAPDGPARVAAVAVVASLTGEISEVVETVSATTRDDVTLNLKSGSKVVWGSPEKADAKARVFLALVSKGARDFDVSAPDLPTTLGRRPKETASPRADSSMDPSAASGDSGVSNGSEVAPEPSVLLPSDGSASEQVGTSSTP